MIKPGQKVEINNRLDLWISTDEDGFIKNWVDCGAVFKSGDGEYGIEAGTVLVCVNETLENGIYGEVHVVPQSDPACEPIRIPASELLTGKYFFIPLRD